MRYIDLSHTLNNDTKVSPFDKEIVMKRVKFLEEDHFNDTEMTSTMHIGTHIDAPSHMLDSEINVSNIDINRFIGKGVFLDFKNKKNIDLREEDKLKIEENSIVMIYTNMDKVIGSEEYYFNHPKISLELCNYLVEKKVKIVALDFYSPDSLPSTIHKILLKNNILIVENIKDAHLLKGLEDFTLYMMPIKIDAEGAMIRAFASVK